MKGYFFASITPNFKRVFLKTVSVTVGVLFLVNATVYACSLSRDTLRVPSIFQDEKFKTRVEDAADSANLSEVEALIQSTVHPYLEDMTNRLEQLREYVDGVDSRIINELQEPYDVYGKWDTLQFTGTRGNSYEANVFRVRVKNNVVLGPAKGGIRYCTSAELMNKTGVFKATLDRLSELGATKEQVEKFIAKWMTEEAHALSLNMTLKNSGAGLDLGGGKGDVFIGYAIQEGGRWVLKDYDNLRADANIAKIARSDSRDLARANKIGIDIDIPATDTGTNQQILSWYEDEYLRYLIEETTQIRDADIELYRILKTILDKGGYDPTKTPLLEAANAYSKQGKPVPWLGVFTGKPAGLGGSLGRTEATGFGSVDVIRTFIDVRGKTVSIQGFGNVGAHAALGLAREGAIVRYINDHTLTLYREEGFSVTELKDMVDWVNTRPRGQALIDYYSDARINAQPKGKFDKSDWKTGLDERTREILSAEVDVLVLAALESQIREDNVGIINAKIVVEGANGPTTRAAERELYKRGVSVIHDTLANVGGAIVSSVETEQAVLGRWYSAEEVGARRRQTLERASLATKATMKKYGIASYRIAGDLNAVLRIARAKKVLEGKPGEGLVLPIRSKRMPVLNKFTDLLRPEQLPANRITLPVTRHSL